MVSTRRQKIASSQHASSLLRLPLELRMEIYTLVLGGQRIHLVYPRQRKTLHHIKSKNPDLTEPLDFAYRIAEQKRSKIDGIALLETCRQIKAEAVGIAFSSGIVSVNKWLFPITVPILGPPNMSLRQSLCQIRRLEVDWRFEQLPTKDDMTKEAQRKTNQITWTTHWRMIAKDMPRLRVLYVRVEFWQTLRWDVGKEMHWAEPMLDIRNLQACRVFLREAFWNAFFELEDLGDTMCSPHPAMCIQGLMEAYPQASDVWLVANGPSTYTSSALTG